MVIEGTPLQSIPVFMFHKIEPGYEVGINALSPGRFRRHLLNIREAGYTPVTFKKLLSGQALPEQPCILTFDDAYESVFRRGFPIMQELGFPGVVFVIADFVGEQNTWDANLGGLRFPHMDRQQLKELLKSGWEAGGHGLRHIALPYLSTALCQTEICESKKRLEALLDAELISFAYPFGMASARETLLVRQCGYRIACVGVGRSQHPADPFLLPRIPVCQATPPGKLFRYLQQGQPSPTLHRYLRALTWGASLTPLYQRLFKPQLFR